MNFIQIRASPRARGGSSPEVYGNNGYDAWVRDGLRPSSEELERVHRLVDAALGIEHTANAPD